MAYNCCPACNCKDKRPHTNREGMVTIGVYECASCGGVYGTCYLGERYDIVVMQWAKPEPPPEQTQYFDLEVLGANCSVERVHGWMDRATRRVVQIG